MKKFPLLLIFFISLIQSNDYLLVDVRTNDEWSAGHLSSAIHIPMQILLDKIPSAANNKYQKIYLYCRSGTRAGKAKTMLENIGYTNVENIGGLDDASTKLKETIIQDLL